MKPDHLRRWLRKYGNLGTVMVAGYLALHFLWKKRRVLFLASCLLLLSLPCLFYYLRKPAQQKQRDNAVPLRSLAPSVQNLPPLPEQEQDELITCETVTIGEDIWRLEVWRQRPSYEDMLKFYRNGQIVQTVQSKELGKIYGGQFFTVRLMHFPTLYPVIAARVRSGAGHGQVTRFYAVRNGQLINLGEVEGECGGPVFRDYDGDGKREWVFDDYDYYDYHDQGPDFYKVYKETADSKLVLWKELPDKQHRGLPYLSYAAPSEDKAGALPPVFADVLQVRLGVDAETRLEHKIGEGEETIGGHSNSGRSWFFPKGLHLLADGFDSNKEGYILDTLVFADWKGDLGSTREFAKLGVGVWSNLRVGMTPEECLRVLPEEMREHATRAEEITWQKEVMGVRAGNKGAFHYQANLRFANGRLESLMLQEYWQN
jgi:hypothetical protein